MSNIVSFFNDEKVDNLSGEAVCRNCGEEWLFVCEVGVVGLECPSCKSLQGYPKNPVVYKDEEHFQCQCGSQQFCLTRNRVYCPLCGCNHKPWE